MEKAFETDYVALIDEAHDPEPPYPQSSTTLHWISMICCCPILTTASSQSRRISNIMLCVGAICAMYYGIALCYHELFLIDDSITYTIIYVVGKAVLVISRFCSLSYFHRRFNFRWINEQRDATNARMRKYTCFISVTFVILMVLELFRLIVGVYRDIVTPFDAMTTTAFYIGQISVHVPLFITFTIAAGLFVRQYARIAALSESMNEHDVNFADHLDEYVNVQTQFEMEYPASLQWCLLCSLFGVLSEAWIYSYLFVVIKERDVLLALHSLSGAAQTLCALIVYFVTASLMTEGYIEYESMVREYGQQHAKQINHRQLAELNYLVQYLCRNQLVVKIGQTQITRMNAVKIIVVFVCARLLSYSSRPFNL